MKVFVLPAIFPGRSGDFLFAMHGLKRLIPECRGPPVVSTPHRDTGEIAKTIKYRILFAHILNKSCPVLSKGDLLY